MAEQTTNKWPGPKDTDVSVADELAYDALPESTRLMAERVLGLRFYDRGGRSYETAYEDGLERGQQVAADAREAEKREMQSRIDNAGKYIERLEGENNRLINANAKLVDDNKFLRGELKAVKRAKA